MGCAFCKTPKCGCGDGPYTMLDACALDQTLFRSLVPCVDQIRNIAVGMGGRVYQVFLIWTQWSGGGRGIGIEQVIRELPILPVPMVSEISALSRTTAMFGTEEDGSVTVTEISGRFTEDDLLGRAPGEPHVDEDVQFYWEIRYPLSGVRRRFTPASAPAYAPTKIYWTMRLNKAIENRLVDGTPE